MSGCDELSKLLFVQHVTNEVKWKEEQNRNRARTSRHMSKAVTLNCMFGWSPGSLNGCDELSKLLFVQHVTNEEIPELNW